jgi:hypothetical protein
MKPRRIRGRYRRLDAASEPGPGLIVPESAQRRRRGPCTHAPAGTDTWGRPAVIREDDPTSERRRTTCRPATAKVAAAAIVVSAFAGWTAILQPVANALDGSAAAVSMDRAAIVALGGVMAIKWVIGWVLYLPR